MLYILSTLIDVVITAYSMPLQSNPDTLADHLHNDEFYSFKYVLTGNPIMNGIMERCKTIDKDDEAEHIQLLIDIGSNVSSCKWFLE